MSWSSIGEVQKSAQAWSFRVGLIFVFALQPGLMQKAKRLLTDYCLGNGTSSLDDKEVTQ